MSYPGKLIQVHDDLSLYMPDPEWVRPTYEELLLKNDRTAFPFWAKVWPSAKALSLFLQQEPGLTRDKNVLELGAGIGLPSFVIAPNAAEVIISDHSEEAVELMKKNISWLGLQNASAMCLDWNDFPGTMRTDVLLLSDINYEPDQFAPLLSLIQRMVEEGTTVILAAPQRITSVSFLAKLTPYVQSSVLQAMEQGDTVTEVSILVLSA